MLKKVLYWFKSSKFIGKIEDSYILDPSEHGEGQISGDGGGQLEFVVLTHSSL